MSDNYFLNTKCADKWQRIGLNRRAGVIVPLFSIRTKNSVGIGEYTDLKIVIDWCKEVGFTILQFLPMNEIGNDFAPYSALSSFALEPMYLSLKYLREVDLKSFKPEIKQLKAKYREDKTQTDYSIKADKLKLLAKIFSSSDFIPSNSFTRFVGDNKYWLRDFTLFKILRNKFNQTGWEKWNSEFKDRQPEAMKRIENENSDAIQFEYWLQWQCYEQLKEIKSYASKSGIKILGDIPFLVSKESADVWSHQNYFKTELSAGAPPDMYFANGQNWGMPTYNWNAIANDGFNYITQRLRYAENFYDIYRIDHFVGLFRVWTVNSSPAEGASQAQYEPSNDNIWEQHGRQLTEVLVNSTSMLPCAEDLGTVPQCSYSTLREFGIPGIDFQRYFKNEAEDFSFRQGNEYRINSSATLSTHDSTFFFNWWRFEAGTIDETLFELICKKYTVPFTHVKYLKLNLFDKRLSRHKRLRWNNSIDSVEKLKSILMLPKEAEEQIIYLYLQTFAEKNKFISCLDSGWNAPKKVSVNLIVKNLLKINQADSIFSIQPIQEYLALDKILLDKMSKWNYRINTPGKVSKTNWSVTLPINIEQLSGMRINSKIKEILKHTYRD